MARPRAPKWFSPERRIDVYTTCTRLCTVARRVETARISLECTPGSRLTVREAENGARPGYRWFCTDKFALGALKTGSDFPGRSTCIGGRTPAQGTDPPKCLGGAQRAQWPKLPVRWSLLTTPLRNPMCRDRPVCAPRVLCESGRAYRAAGAPPICTKPLRRRFRSFSCRHRIS